MGRVVAAALSVVLLFAAGSLGRAGELTVPTDGMDLVRLTDGRVLPCVVGEEGGDGVNLEFPSVTLTVPKERIAEIRYFRDYDPAPRNDEEKEKVEKGLVRWKGKWLDPDRVASIREKEEAPARKLREADEKHSRWADRRIHGTKHFTIESNVPLESLEFYADLLEDYYQHITKLFKIKLTQRQRRQKLKVYVFRDKEEYWKFYEEDTGGEAEHTLGYFVPVIGKERLVLFDEPGNRRETVDVLLHEGTHFLLHLAEPQVLLNRWLHEGLAEYFGASVRVGKKFVAGNVQDGRLLQFQGMLQRNKPVSWDDLFKGGNPAPSGQHVEFGSRHYAQAWTFAHFLVHGKKGRYASGFADYLNRAITGRGGVEYTPIAATERRFLDPDQDRALLLKSLKQRDFSRLEAEFHEYAMSLPLRSARAHVERGEYRLWNERDAEGAEEDFKAARERGGDDPEVLTELARALSNVPRRLGEALDLLRRALELDPLNTSTRYRLGRYLDGNEAVLQFRIVTEIDPNHSDALGELAWAIYREQMEGMGKPKTPAEVDRVDEACSLVRRAVAIDPAHRHLDTLAVLEIRKGEFESAREHAKQAVQMEPESRMYLRTLAVAEAAAGEVKGFLKTMRRLEMILKMPREGGAAPPDRIVKARLGRTMEDAVLVCLSWDKARDAVALQDRWFAMKPPGSESQWYDWADAIDQSGDRKRAREVVAKGLVEYPVSEILKDLEGYLKEGKE